MNSMSLRLPPRALRGLVSLALFGSLLTGLSGGVNASAAATPGSIRTNLAAGVQFSNQVTALTEAFTVEGWWKWADGVSPAWGQLLLGGSGTPGIYLTGNNSLKLTRWGGGYDSSNCTLQNSFVAGSWYHLAIGRSSGGLVTVWVNGSPLQNCSKITVAPFTNLGTNFPTFFGGNGAGALFDGFFANYRATSTDIYGAADARGFQPNSNFYTSITGTINLLNTPNDGASVFSDSIGSPTGFTSHTGGTLSSEFPTYTPKSICFGGNQARYFGYPAGEKIGTSSFTLEMWVKPKSWTNYMTFLETGYGSGNGSYLGYNVNTGPRAIIFYTAEQLGSTGPGVPVDSWSHVAVVRDQVTMKMYMYINGSKVSEGNSTSYDFSNSRLSIGNDFNGCMTSVRLAKSALYTSNFTPAAKGSFSSIPDATNVLVALSANNDSMSNIGTAGLMQGTGTITFEDLPKLSQTITFGSLGNKTLGMSAFALSASSSSGQSATFTSATSGTCTVSGSTVTLVSAGTCTINADQAGNVDYDAATQVQQSFTIYTNQSALVLSAASGRFGSTTTLATTGGSGSGSVSYDVVSGNCSVAGDVLSATSAGNCVITATKASDGTYGSITSAQLTIVISNNSTISYSGGAGVAGTLPSAEVKLTNETITVGSDSGITKTGYTFAHWSNGISSFSPGSVFTVGAADETLTAQWTINSYAITFDANGGSGGTSASLNYNVDALISAPTVTRSQYIFAGWAETVTATSINSWTVTGSKTLYSLWTPKVYTITYLPESGTATVSSETFTVGTSPIVLQVATRSGYKFNGWFTSKTGGTLIGTAGAQFTPTDTATVHAQWIQASLVGLSSPTSFGTIVATSGNDGGISATRSGTKAEIDYFADSLPDGTVITAYLQGSTVYAASQLTGESNLLLSVVVAWKALDETVPLVDPSKSAIRLKITNPDIKRGAKVYSIVGDTSTVITTAAQDGYVVIDLREDPEIVIANPVVVPAPTIVVAPAPAPVVVAPAPAPVVVAPAPAPDPSIAEAELKAKQEAEAKTAAELKVAQELAEAALKAAREKAEQELKDALAKADEAARLKAEADARVAAELKAIEDAALAAALAQKKIVPNVTFYSILPMLKLSTYDRAYLNKYVSTLKANSTVTCIGYIYAKNVSASIAKSRASKQATAICAMIKSQKKTITTKVLLYPSWKAPKAAAGAKWVAVSYRVDGFKS
jgi:uncharacterized repeat protein (TIGR02543 family)